MHIPYLLKVLIAGVLPFMLGWLWYGRLFGARWAKAVGVTKPEDCKNLPPEIKRQMQINMAASFIGWLVAALMFGWIYNNLSYGSIPPLCLALALWAGFCVPHVVADVLWANRARDLIWIQAGYQLASLMIIAIVMRFF